MLSQAVATESAMEICLEKSDGVFTPGDSVRGCVCVDNSYPINCQGVKLTLHGKGKVFILKPFERELVVQVNRTGRHYDFVCVQPVFDVHRENYLSCTKVVVNQEGMPESDVIKPGRHVYPFEFSLPALLPCSYQSNKGRIQYKLSCVINSPLSSRRSKCKKYLTVLPSVDLNFLPGVMESHGDAASLPVYMCCLEDASVSAEISVTRCGYVPGEFVTASAFIDNKSNQRVLRTVLELVQSVKYNASGSVSTESYVIQSVQGQSLEAGRTLSWNPINLEVPPLPSTTVNGGFLIEVSYILQLRVVVANATRPVIAKIGLTIGTVPHHQVTRDYLQYYHSIAYQVRPQPGLSTAVGFHALSAVDPPSVSYREGPHVLSENELKSKKREQSLRSFSIPPSRPQQRTNVPNVDDTRPPEYTEFRPKYIFYDWKALHARLTQPYDLPPRAY